MTLRVLVAEDTLLLRDGIMVMIDRQPDLEVIGGCDGLEQLTAMIAADAPDVVVTDVRMPPTFTDEGIRVAVELRQTHPEIGVVVLSQYAEPGYANALLADGSSGRAYLLKERVSERDQLPDAIRAVARGGSVIDSTVVDLLVRSSSNRRPTSALASLSPRELDVLDQVAQGKSNAGVATALSLTERAVEKHINALFAKLGLSVMPDVNRRVAAVLLHLSERGSI